MLKLVQRTRQAERQTVRRAQKAEAKAAKAAKWKRLDEQKPVMLEIQSQVQLARRLRRELWTMGDLAPRHDHAAGVADRLQRRNESGSTAYANPDAFATVRTSHWGSLNMRRVLSDSKTSLPDAVVASRCAWAGGPKSICLAEGDRVVVVEGPYKGSIGPIQDIQTDTGVVTITGVGVTNTTVLEAIVTSAGETVQATEAVIPIDAIRLVHPLTDPETGVTRDVIIRQLRPVTFQLDRATRRLSFSRVVPGINVRIPWPRLAERPAPPEDKPADTLRIDAEQVTFVPTLLRPPAPEAVLDELRNRFSRFRTRHTPEYIARKEAAEAASEEVRRYSGRTPPRGRQPHLPPPGMRTPLDEFHLQQKALRRARGQPTLTDDMLEKIGRIMAQTRALRLGSSSSGGDSNGGNSSSSNTDTEPPPKF